MTTICTRCLVIVAAGVIGFIIGAATYAFYIHLP